MHLFWTNDYPGDWIVQDADGRLWLVPCTDDGWSQRERYCGDMRVLNPCEATIQDLAAQSCGLPAGKEEVHA